MRPPFPRLRHAEPLTGMYAVPLDDPGPRPDRPRTLPPVRITACADWALVGSHFSRSDWLWGVAYGHFPVGTQAVIGGETWVIVERYVPSPMGPRHSKRAKPLRPRRVAVRI